MKKTALFVVLALLTTVSTFAQSDEDFEVQQLADNTLAIMGYKGTVTAVVIPRTLYGLKVTLIGKGAFSSKGLTSVVIPDTVTIIGNSAFEQNKITSVVIPDSVTRIVEQAFQRNELTSVKLGVGLIRIDARAFAYNKTLESIVIPNSVTEIGGYAFSECGLTSVTLGNRVQEIRGYAFSQNKLTEIILPASLKFMGSHAFGENQITSLTIPNGVICISGTFIGNPIVTLVLPASLAKQGPWGSISYEDDRGGRNIYTPGSISGFRDCPLTRITFPANMDNENLSANFDTNLVNAYKSQNRAAGTYVKNGPVWSKQ